MKADRSYRTGMRPATVKKMDPRETSNLADPIPIHVVEESEAAPQSLAALSTEPVNAAYVLVGGNGHHILVLAGKRGSITLSERELEAICAAYYGTKQRVVIQADSKGYFPRAVPGPSPEAG